MNVIVTIIVVCPIANRSSDRSLTRNGARNRPRCRGMDRHISLQRILILDIRLGPVDASFLRRMFGVLYVPPCDTSLKVAEVAVIIRGTGDKSYW